MEPSSIGDYTVKGSFKMGEKEVVYEGRAAMRLILGGGWVVRQYEANMGEAKMVGAGLSSLTDDGKTLKEWWFSNFNDGPVLLAGTLSETEWKGKAETSPHGPFDMTWTKTPTGFDLKATFAGAGSVTETYTKTK